MSTLPINLSDDEIREFLNEDEGRNFERLFSDVLQNIIEQQNESEHVQKIEDSLSNLNDSFRYDNPARSCKYSDLDFNDIWNLCAHTYRMSPVSAGVSRFMTLVLLRHCPELKAKVTEDGGSELTVTSLGGADGADIVGFCSAICGAEGVTRPLKLTVVEKYHRWKQFFYETFRLAKNGEYGLVSEMPKKTTTTLDFAVADLQKSSAMEYIMKAQIVIMKGVLSIQPTGTDIWAIKKVVVQGMKIGAILLLIDWPHYRDFFSDRLRKIAEYYHRDRENPDVFPPFPYCTPSPFEPLYGNGITCASKMGISVYIKPSQ